MLTLHAIEELADRIERAYLRRQPNWRRVGASPRVWAAAAVALLRTHRSDPAVPLDPELYVASQPIETALTDPWEELAQACSARRYRRRVYQIIRKLRRELHAEVRQAEARIEQGEAVDDVLTSKNRALTPLGRYIVAHRAGRPDLADRFRRRAQDQHRACPLYREACRRLLPHQAYPVVEILSGRDLPPRRSSRGIPQFSLN